jgi:protein gp37
VIGCTKISPGCKHCYAERRAKRLHAMGQPNYKQWGGANKKKAGRRLDGRTWDEAPQAA